MGISELLRKLGPITEGKHISEFANLTAAIDIMNWLYKGLYACAANTSQDEKSDLYLNYPLKMLALLKVHNITPIVVFDGKTVKEKEKIEEERRENRETNIEKAKLLKNAGNEDESKKFFKRGLKIKNKMKNTLIEILKQLEIKVIVAPYEADSQIAYLVRKNYADFAISEDSDLIALGVRNIVMKLNPEGTCMNINYEAFRNSPIENYSDKLIRDIKNMPYVNFLELVVMSGCDYLPSIKGFGFKTGMALFEKYKKMENVFHEMKFIERYKTKIPENYLENAKKSVCMFFYQTVFDPEENKLISLNSHRYEEGDDLERTYSKEYINRYVSQLLYKRNLDENDSKLVKSKKIYKEISEKIHQELNSSEGNDFPLQQEDLFKLFGEEFPNAALYCNGLLDLKTFSSTKKLEEEKTFIHYKNKYNIMFNVNRNAMKKDNENFRNDIDKNQINNNIEDYKSINRNKDKIEDEFNEEEILRIINEEIEIEDSKNFNKDYEKNNNNIFLNKKRTFNNDDIYNDYDNNRDSYTPITQSPKKSIHNMRFLNLNKSNEGKGKRDLLDIINRERNVDSNLIHNYTSKIKNLNQEEEKKEYSQSPIE